MKKETVEKILKETEVGYDLISEKFSQTRNKFWGGLGFINKYSKCCGRILDFGCGNGRLLEILGGKHAEYVGVDVSQELINLAENNHRDKDRFKSVQFFKIDHDLKNLDFSDNFFNTVYSIAVFHHLPGENIRLERARDLYRVTSEGGYVVVTVWNLWQKKYLRIIIKNWIDKMLGKSELDWNDAWIRFTNNKGDVFNRYHHAFTKNDLKKTFRRAGFSVKKIKKIDGNIVLIGEKQNKASEHAMVD